jgi:hypothetical protein
LFRRRERCIDFDSKFGQLPGHQSHPKVWSFRRELHLLRFLDGLLQTWTMDVKRVDF